MNEGDSTAWRSLASPALLRSLVVAGGVMLIVGVTAHVLVTLTTVTGFARALASQFSRLFYAGTEFTVWAWYTAVLMAAVGVTLAIIGLLRHRADAGSSGAARSTGTPYVVLAAVALALSVDETAQFHEGLSPVAGMLGLHELPTFGWLVVGIPLAIVVGAVLLVVARRIDARLRRGLIIGGALFLFGALVLEGLGGLLARSVDLASSPVAALGYQVLLAVEEGVELAGVLVALAAALAMLEVRGGGASVELRVRGAGGAASVEA